MFLPRVILSYDATGSGREGSEVMNGVDYTRQMAKDREYFRDAAKKTKDAGEKRLADVEARHDHVQDKQLKAFVEDKADLEKNYQKQLDNMNEKTVKSIHDGADNYNQRLEDERSRFSKDSFEKRKELDQKFNDIKNSYRRASDSESEHNQHVEETHKKNYDNSITEFKRDSNEKLKSYQDKMQATGGSLKDQYNQERAQLVRAHEDQLKSQQKDNSHKNEELRHRIGQDIKRTREVSEADAGQAKQYASDSMNNMRHKFDERSNTMSTDFSQRNKEIGENQQRDNLKSNRQHQEQLSNVQRDFNRELRRIEIDQRRGNTGSGEFAQVMKQQKGLNDQIQHENQMKSMRNKLTDAQRLYQERASREQDSFNETLKSENTDASIRLERKLNEVNAEKISTISHEREKNHKQLENVIYKSKNEQEAHDQQLIVERSAAKDRLNKLKENFNKSMTTLEEKNKLILQDVAKNNNVEKAEYTKKMNEARNQEIFSMKREFGKMFDATVEDYEKRISIYQRDNEHLKMLMDQKVQNIIDQTEKQVTSLRKNFEEQRSVEVKAQALMNDQRDYQHNTSVTQMNSNFQKKLDKLQVANDTKLKLLTNDYENKLKELQASTTKTVIEKDMTQAMEQERLKQAYEAEKVRMVTGYENQINEMKRTHQNQVEQLREYKRLS